MNKKIVTIILFSLLAFCTTSSFAQIEYARALGVYPVCTGCHKSQSNPRSGSGLLPGAAWNKLAISAAITCTLPKVLNTAKTACITPTPTCTSTQVLTNNVCVTKAVANTKPVLNAVVQQWDAQVGELLTIPLSVNDAEQDDFVILPSLLVGSKLGDVYQSEAGFPTVDFKWTPTTANVNKIQAITFQAKETATKQKYVSNKISVKVRVWAAGNRDAASITKLNVMTSKFTAGNLKLAGNVKFNGLLTATERNDFIAQPLDLTVTNNSDSALIGTVALTLDVKGNWSATLPIAQNVCDIVLQFDGQNASRKVVGCTK